MPAGTNYWTRRRVSRRAALRGAGVGIAGLAGAALIGCGGDDDDDGGVVAESTTTRVGEAITQQQQATAVATAEASDQPVSEDQIKIPPGVYDSPVAATPAEANPLINATRGGTLVYRYLDPPHMDINRTLSCTVFHTMDYTQNKVTRGKTGALAHPFLVELEPDLAESWESNADSTEFTFHIRKGIKTHNVDPTFGREYTSEDIKLSMERYQSGGVQKDVFGPVTAIETPDDYTVKVSLDQPLADFPLNLAAWSFMWVKEMVGDDEAIRENAVGTGAFVRKDWVKKERSTFEAHPDYFEEGLPFLDEITVVVQSDAATLRAGFQTGDFWGWGARDDDDSQAMFDDLQDSMVMWKHPRSRGANVNGWHFQMTNPTFQDIRVRRAISLAFDRDEFDLAQYNGDNASPDGAFSLPPMPWAFLFDEYPTAKANGQYYRRDLARASELMQAAGFSADNPLKWEHIGYYDRNVAPESIVPSINELPELDVTFRQVDNPTQVQMLSDRNFDESINIVWGPPGYSMDQWIFPWWHSKGGLNYNNVDDPAMDSLLEAQRSSTDLEEKKVIWQDVWDMIHDQVWDFWWPQPLNRHAWHNWVLNQRSHGLMGSYVCYTSGQARAMWLAADAPQR